MTIEQRIAMTDANETDEDDTLEAIKDAIYNGIDAIDQIDTAIFLANYTDESKKRMRTYLADTMNRLETVWHWLDKENAGVDFDGHPVKWEG